MNWVLDNTQEFALILLDVIMIYYVRKMSLCFRDAC